MQKHNSQWYNQIRFLLSWSFQFIFLRMVQMPEIALYSSAGVSLYLMKAAWKPFWTFHFSVTFHIPWYSLDIYSFCYTFNLNLFSRLCNCIMWGSSVNMDEATVVNTNFVCGLSYFVGNISSTIFGEPANLVSV